MLVGTVVATQSIFCVGKQARQLPCTVHYGMRCICEDHPLHSPGWGPSLPGCSQQLLALVCPGTAHSVTWQGSASCFLTRDTSLSAIEGRQKYKGMVRVQESSQGPKRRKSARALWGRLQPAWHSTPLSRRQASWWSPMHLLRPPSLLQQQLASAAAAEQHGIRRTPVLCGACA